MKLEEYLVKLKSNLNERVEISLNFMVNLFGALVLGCVTLILGLLLLLCLIVSLPVMLVLVLSLGPLMFSLNKVRRVRSLGRTKSSKKVLRKAGLNTKEIWDKIMADGGSIQDLPLDDYGYVNKKLVVLSEQDDLETTGFDKVKNVFKTFKEINQLELVNQAGIRQQYIDQSVSLNLAFPSEATPKWINQVHMDAPCTLR
eukprot:TRINITY_DN44_c0_g1_i3.p1 TRINITY_DN44_c0_g1~~TRINITY_DN44_c0_g1_i3.p1  ORF type:complete len:200 (+),score=12.12 TRINITY_DN44_c0_g1_i3:58-657(+)